MVHKLDYVPDGKVLRDFMTSQAFVRGLQGPINSGKSACCVIECLRLMLEQEKSVVEGGGRSGKRKVRVGVIRNTTPQLETTTMKTWLDWLPENVFGPMRWRSPFLHTIRLKDHDLEAEVWFLALDRDEDVRKLLSFEFTFIWLNEARELSRHVVASAISRVNRYPRTIEGGATRACVIMDTNAPAEDHWWSIMSGQTTPPDWMTEEDRLTLIKPPNWEFFIQPAAVLDVFAPDGSLSGYALNPERENAKFASPSYYPELLQGQTRDWIRNMLQNKIGRIFSGRPVYRDFSPALHVALAPFGPTEDDIIHVGIDFGLTPAAVFAQDVRGQVRVFDELVSKDMHAKQFAKLLHEKIMDQYPTRRIVFTGDPAGEGRKDTDGTTPYLIFKDMGLDAQPAWTNDPGIRQGAVQTQMVSLSNGKPGYFLSPACTYLVAAKNGGYCFKKGSEDVDKDSIYSHVSDAEQYAVLRMGYGKKLLGRGGEAGQRRQTQAVIKQAVFNRGGAGRAKARTGLLSRGYRGS